MEIDTRLIPLTQSQFATVSPEDYEWLSQWKWTAHRARRLYGPAWYAIRMSPSPKRKMLYLHREIAKRAFLPQSKQYDHKDRNGLNNTRQNIRPCTANQNGANTTKSPGKSSRFIGVFWFKAKQKWAVRIRTKEGRKFIGYFDNEVIAARAYNEAAARYHGEFARLNEFTEEELCLAGL